jgi:hypothetical protein
VGIPYFGPFLCLTPLPPTHFQQLSILILTSSTFTSCFKVLLCSVVLFSFPSFPEFHRVVPLLQSCSTFEFVYDHAGFCVYVYLLDLSSMNERKHTAFVFLSLAHFLYVYIFFKKPRLFLEMFPEKDKAAVPTISPSFTSCLLPCSTQVTWRSPLFQRWVTLRREVSIMGGFHEPGSKMCSKLAKVTHPVS